MVSGVLCGFPGSFVSQGKLLLFWFLYHNLNKTPTTYSYDPWATYGSIILLHRVYEGSIAVNGFELVCHIFLPFSLIVKH